MPAMEAVQLVLRTRVVLERVRAGESERALIGHLLEITAITGFITQAGYGKLDVALVHDVRRDLAHVLACFDEAGRRGIDDSLIDRITSVVNEYDRMVGAVRLEVLMRACDHLERSGTGNDPTAGAGE